MKEVYDEIAEDYTDHVTSGSSSNCPSPVKQFQTELVPGSELSDAGCGPGRPTLPTSKENGVGLIMIALVSYRRSPPPVTAIGSKQ
jgi:hypothetical protein